MLIRKKNKEQYDFLGLLLQTTADIPVASAPIATFPLSYISMCSGIESASVAAEPLEWKPVCFSEIEAFPSAVLAHHYPHVPNLGDMTAVDWSLYAGQADLVVAGTPCQAFSVAGARKGLADARGNLSMVFTLAVNEINPPFIMWENVPGVLTSKDNAFGCFLAGLAGEDVPLVPPGGRWTDAGYVSGPTRSIAWRVLNAEYFGLAQRRRRVFVVACPRDGADPRAILFESESLRRDTTPSREAGPAVAALTANGVGTCGADDNQEQAGHLIATDGVWPPDVAPTLDASYGAKWGLDDQHVNSGCGLFTIQHQAATLSANSGRNQIEATYIPVAFSVALRGREGGATAELGDDLAGTLRASSGGGDKPHVLAFNWNAQADEMNFNENTTPTLTRSQEPASLIGSRVRRLMPSEVEKLQGFPVGYTLVPYRGKPAADGPRYKAIGNSKAVPVVRWIFQRIANEAARMRMKA